MHFSWRRQNKLRYQARHGQDLPQPKEDHRPGEREQRKLHPIWSRARQYCLHRMIRRSTIARTLVVRAPKTATVIIPTAIIAG